MLRKCCSARISVGAMNATCSPFSIATSAASSATIVFPAPTSPWSSRFIGCGRCKSSTISLSACFWPFVNRNDPSRVDRLALFVLKDFVLGIRELQRRPRAGLGNAVKDHALAGDEDVPQKGLVQPDDAHRPAFVGDERFENLEAGTARGS